MLLKTRRVVVNAARSVQSSVAGDAADYMMTDNGAYGLFKIKKFLPKDFQAETIHASSPTNQLKFYLRIFP